ncbi:MAG: hypothetical protein E6R04_05620 [Spirochaetes bacterium]|nr:MAG: hypothetical protein E6R04_05620 [Spirochaetota bacterium]
MGGEGPEAVAAFDAGGRVGVWAVDGAVHRLLPGWATGAAAASPVGGGGVFVWRYPLAQGAGPAVRAVDAVPPVPWAGGGGEELAAGPAPRTDAG